jgi:hypothetical protein
MGVSRTLTAAYAQYLKEIGKFGLDESRKVLAVSKSFRQWSIDFSWDDRAKDWDAGHAKRLQAKLLEADQDKYINSVEKLRTDIEIFANESLQAARLNNAIAPTLRPSNQALWTSSVPSQDSPSAPGRITTPTAFPHAIAVLKMVVISTSLQRLIWFDSDPDY